MAVIVEVAVSDGLSSTDKGKLLEKLGAQILEAQQYEVTSEVRLTGMEVDLLARHKITGEEAFIECKAYRDPFSADVITKLLGNVTFKSVSAGWLITTAQLNKEGKGLQLEWEKKASGERRRLQFYTPERIIDVLVSNKLICSPEILHRSQQHRYSEDSYFLVTNHGRFWATPLINADAGVPYAVLLYDGVTGVPISDPSLVDAVSQTNSSLEELEWLVHGMTVDSPRSPDLATEAQSIVAVAAGDQWADYRPARPQDFVGRKKLQSDIFQFLENVRNGSSTTRIVAIKSPSGWGKSSVLLKLIDRCGNIRNRGKYFMYAVDARAATSARYGELALVTCLRTAVECGFVPSPTDTIRLAGTANPLSDSTIIPLLQSLRDEQKVIVLIFDQFEEIFAKKELSSLFENIRSLCTAIDGVQENIVIGFAWKIGGTIPEDHPAYFMWHNLSDRRHEFSLTPFSKTDISEALTLFTRELGSPLNPILRRHLADHCQGYPWLLKKLCIHVYDSVQQGIDQTEILGKSLNVKELFERDESELSSAELACLKRIAAESPADFFQIQDTFGGDTVNSLFNRRLVLRRGSRLTLYWDIFRDFVLTRTVPQIPVTYIPTAAFRRYCDALGVLLEEKQTTIPDLAIALNLSEGTVENIVSDLVMVGNAQRQSGVITALQETESEALPVIRAYLSSHILMRHLLREEGSGFSTSTNEMTELFPVLFPNPDFSTNTWRQYVNRLIGWLVGTGLLISQGYSLTHVADGIIPKTPTLSILRRKGVRNRRAEFLGQAPPSRVFEAINLINTGTNAVSDLRQRGHRNSLHLLSSINAIVNEGSTVSLTFTEDPHDWLSSQVRNTPAMEATIEFLRKRPLANGEEVGAAVKTQLQAQWKPSSMLRNGNGLLQWFRWLENKQSGLFNEDIP